MDKIKLANNVASNAAEAASKQVAFWLDKEEDEEFIAAVFSAAATKLCKLADMYRSLSDSQPSEPPLEPHLRPLEQLVRVKAEAYEYRIYDLELAYMMQLAGTPESAAAKAIMEKVTASYHRDYPSRPLNPRPRPSEQPTPSVPFGPAAAEKKPRKPYTRKAKAA